MAKDDLPEADRIIRYCSPKKVGDDGLPLSEAFALRSSDSYLSVNWIEYFSNDINKALSQIRIDNEAGGVTLRANGRFAMLVVREVLSSAKENVGVNLQIRHKVITKKNPSHSGIFGYGIEDDEVCVAIKKLVTEADVFPGKI